uniref:Uncharacterized protein n=1 Tax=Lepeophtheirus salmonis TaxID=72036 RepID=A0A0K2TB52_LEPSM
MSFSISTMQQLVSSTFVVTKINGNRVPTRDTHSTKNLMHLHSYIIHHCIMDFIHYFWSSNLNRVSSTFRVTSPNMATPQHSSTSSIQTNVKQKELERSV